MKNYLLLLFIFLVSCTTRIETQFSEKALNATFISLEGKELPFKDILEKYKGEKILIDVWATWCGDCIKGMPTIVQLQKEYQDVVFLFLSIDSNLVELKTGIEKYRVKGVHYLLPSGWDGSFGDFLDLSWIPRYLVVDKEGKIAVFNAVKANDERIVAALKK
ncbi:TlpA family protein disulfide reductase [Tenacibaculum amylolyticum]|uniref:TlpA family protein disulfide reductase n=1 Tax=Tenacibaculum amylolyticum TaxID=104269 RepID=UPI003894ADD7